MAIMLDPGLAEVLNYLGFNWPTTNEDALGELADALREVAGAVEGQRSDAEAAVAHVAGSNQGGWVDAAVATLRGEGSELEVLAGVAEGARDAAAVAEVAAVLVVGMKAVVAFQVAVTVASLAGGPLSVVARLAAQYAINVAVDKVAGKILGEG